MKRILALLLSVSLLFTGCSGAAKNDSGNDSEKELTELDVVLD